MSQLPDIYTVEQAAQYLGLTRRGIKYHLYESGYLSGKTLGHTIVFTRAELDAFKARNLKPGRKAK
jgi:excisionase family DNA binding protein